MSPLATLSVVVAEDNANMRHLLCRLLSVFGVASIAEAASGEHAIDVLRRSPQDILITDCHMAPVDGVELTHWVRCSDDSPDAFLPIVMVSSLAETYRHQQAINAGVNHFLAKPIRPKDLLLALHHVVQCPRPFVRTATYFGPDRRHPARQLGGAFNGIDRRQVDSVPLIPSVEHVEHSPAKSQRDGMV